MEKALRRRIWERAFSRCEYCQIPNSPDYPVHEIDHIIAEKHRGRTTFENLALACFPCNNAKSSNIAGLDPETGKLTRLFNPRIDLWEDHFQWQGPLILGLTDIGRTTVQVLSINQPDRMIYRIELQEVGLLPATPSNEY